MTQEELNYDFKVAVDAFDIAKTKHLLESGADPDTFIWIGTEGGNMLLWAAIHYNNELFSLGLDYGADPLAHTHWLFSNIMDYLNFYRCEYPTSSQAYEEMIEMVREKRPEEVHGLVGITAGVLSAIYRHKGENKGGGREIMSEPAGIDSMISRVVEQQKAAALDRSAVDNHSKEHKAYAGSLAERVDEETKKLVRTIYIMRARIAQELENERLLREIRAHVVLEAERNQWTPDDVQKQTTAANTMLLDIFQSEMMAHLGTLAHARQFHHKNTSSVTYMYAFLKAIDDPGMRKMVAEESKKALARAGYHIAHIDEIMASMPRIKAVAKRNDRGLVDGVALRLKGTYAETWRLVQASHRDRIQEICRDITEQCPLDRKLMARMMSIAEREIEGMLPGAMGSRFAKELSRLEEQVSMAWCLNLDPKKKQTPTEPPTDPHPTQGA